jgi:RNA polymerase sigma factor (sigma-70 family)
MDSAYVLKTNGEDATSLNSGILEEAWQTHAKKILRVTERITNNREDAEDALQDTFLRAHLHLRSFDGRSSIVTWLTRIAINSALLILRKRASAPQFSIDEPIDAESVAPSIDPADQRPTPEEQYADFEQRAIVRSAIQALRPANQRALEMQTVEGRPVKEIAEQMGLSMSATKSRLFHAKEALRRSLGPKVGRRSDGAKQLQLSPA